MSKLTLFNAIDAQIVAAAPSIKTVQLWNNQLENESREEVRQVPIVYIEFSEIEWESNQKGYQLAPITVTLHIVIEEYATDDRTHLAIVDEVFTALHMLEANTFTALTRTSERQDIDHDNLIVWEVDYTTTLQDNQAFVDRDKATVSGATLVINKQLDVDDEVIRSGDGTF